MSRILKGTARFALALSLVFTLGVAGCGGSKTVVDGNSGKSSSSKDGKGGGRRAAAVSEEDKARLEEARKAAETAERELSDYRLQRIELEGGQ